MYFLLGYEFTLVTCRNRIICKFNNLAKDAKKNNRIVCKHVQTMFWVAHTFCYDKSRGVKGIREMVPRITSCGRDVWSQKIALRREWCLHFFLQVQTWNPPEGENHVDGQAWAGHSLWRCFLELTNFLWLHAAMVAIEATDWLDSNCMLQTFVLLSPRHPWSHDFQCTWAYKCSVWHTHAGKMSLPCLYKFKQDMRKTVKVTQLHIWFLQNLRIADLLIPFKFHECLEAMLATSTPASLGHQRSKCDFDWASAAITVEDVHCRHTKGSTKSLPNIKLQLLFQGSGFM